MPGAEVSPVAVTAIVVSASALFFTVYSFWWTHWRPGKLQVSRPRSFALSRSSQREVLAIALPLVFLNRGASPVVVTNARLRVRGPTFTDQVFAFNNTATTLDLKADRHMAVPFPVAGNQAVSLICEFARLPGDLSFQAGRYGATLEVTLDRSRHWAPMLDFELHFDSDVISAANDTGYIAIDSDAGDRDLSERARKLRFPLGVV